MLNIRVSFSVVAVLVSAGATVPLLAADEAALSPQVPAVVPSFGTDDAGPTVHPEWLLVRVDPDAAPEAVAAALAAAGVLERRWTSTLVPGLMSVRVESGRVEKAVAVLAAQPVVLYAEADQIRWALAQTSPYGIGLVRAPQVWPTTRGQGARVAVLDTGVDLGHPDLPDPVVSASFITGQTVQDANDHGTHCSGTVLAIDNTDGVVGVAPQAALMTGKVLSNSGSGPTSGIIAGVDWAVANGADVISMSLGGGGFSQAFLDACTAAVEANAVVIAAAGNSNSGLPSYPGSYEPVINVAAVDSARNRASFSNFGPTIDIAAPGVGVLSTVPVSSPRTAALEFAGFSRSTGFLTGSGIGTVEGPIVSCGVGAPEEFPPEVNGAIAHIRRGGTSPTGATWTFAQKTANALAAGARAVIISNNNGALFSGTLSGAVEIPVVAVSQTDGDELAQGTVDGVVSVSGGSGYASFNGTSMATPHVAGVAGLLVSSAGSTRYTVAQVRRALEETAADLGDPGRDDLFGHGLVDASAALARFQALIVACAADVNADGVVNDDDLGEFVTAYFEQLPGPGGFAEACSSTQSDQPAGFRADFTRDCSLNDDDLGGFITAYFAGGDC